MSELLAFTSDHVARLTGLSHRQVRYWDQTEFFAPTLLADHSRRSFGRVYSFRDVVGLRTISVLRNQHRVPLQELRRVGAWLQEEEKHETPWASLRFGLAGRKVVFINPKTGLPTEPRTGAQTVLSIAVDVFASEMLTAAEKLRHRATDQFGEITRNRYVVHNAHVVAGTRIPTRAVWNFHKAGYSVTKIIREYPRLTKEDIRAAIEFESSRQKAA